MKGKTELFTVGELAKILGGNKNTILHYDREGVIRAIRNDDSNYRYYDKNSIQNFKIVLKLRKLGFSLDTIKKMGKYVEEKNYPSILEIMKNKIEESKREIEEIEKNMKILESHEKYMEYLNDMEEEKQKENFNDEQEDFFCIKTCKEEKGIFIDVEDVEKNHKRFVEKELKRYKRDFVWLKKQFFGKGISKENILKENYRCDRFIIKADIESYPDKYIFPEGEYALLYLKKDSTRSSAIEELMEKIKENGYEISGDLFIENISLFEEENEPEMRVLKIPIKSLTSE